MLIEEIVYLLQRARKLEPNTSIPDCGIEALHSVFQEIEDVIQEAERLIGLSESDDERTVLRQKIKNLEKRRNGLEVQYQCGGYITTQVFVNSRLNFQTCRKEDIRQYASMRLPGIWPSESPKPDNDDETAATLNKTLITSPSCKTTTANDYSSVGSIFTQVFVSNNKTFSVASKEDIRKYTNINNLSPATNSSKMSSVNDSGPEMEEKFSPTPSQEDSDKGIHTVANTLAKVAENHKDDGEDSVHLEESTNDSAWKTEESSGDGRDSTINSSNSALGHFVVKFELIMVVCLLYAFHTIGQMSSFPKENHYIINASNGYTAIPNVTTSESVSYFLSRVSPPTNGHSTNSMTSSKENSVETYYQLYLILQSLVALLFNDQAFIIQRMVMIPKVGIG